MRTSRFHGMQRDMAESKDTLFFLKSWVRAPLRVAAIAPSGRALARLIASEIDVASAPVLELGPGTGVFTRALLARGLRQEDLTLVEQDARFATLLAGRFPRARLLNIDAGLLGLEHGVGGFGGAVSGLPLLSMPRAQVCAILDAAFSAMRGGAALYQFTYGFRCPVPDGVLADLGLRSTRMGSAIANLPPATVYRIARIPQ
jgi:phospholipid N-methyltransferase